jgi:chromosome segregation ATPase
VAEARIAELIADYDEKIEVVLKDRDNFRALYDEARKRIAELQSQCDRAETMLRHSEVACCTAENDHLKTLTLLEKSRKKVAELAEQNACWQRDWNASVREVYDLKRLKDALTDDYDRKLGTVVKDRDQARRRVCELEAETRRLFGVKEDAMRMYEEAVADRQQAVTFLRKVVEAEDVLDIEPYLLSKAGEFVARIGTPQFLPCCKTCGVPTPRRYMRGDVCMPCRMKVDGDDRRDTNVELQKLADAHTEACEKIAELEKLTQEKQDDYRAELSRVEKMYRLACEKRDAALERIAELEQIVQDNVHCYQTLHDDLHTKNKQLRERIAELESALASVSDLSASQANTVAEQNKRIVELERQTQEHLYQITKLAADVNTRNRLNGRQATTIAEQRRQIDWYHKQSEQWQKWSDEQRSGREWWIQRREEPFAAFAFESRKAVDDWTSWNGREWSVKPIGEPIHVREIPSCIGPAMPDVPLSLVESPVCDLGDGWWEIRVVA